MIKRHLFVYSLCFFTLTSLQVKASDHKVIGEVVGEEEAGACADSGDLNADGAQNVSDIIIFVNCILVGGCAELQHACAADLNNDTIYNILDLMSIVNIILGTDDESCEEGNDSDTDGVVDACDDCPVHGSILFRG